MRVLASDPGAHQFLLALDHSQCCFVGLAVLPAGVPVSRLLGEVVAFPSVEQPVLWAGRLTLDTTLGSCREGKGLSVSKCAWSPLCPLAFPQLLPSVWTPVPFGDSADVTVPQGGVPDEMNSKVVSVLSWGTAEGQTQAKVSPLTLGTQTRRDPKATSP